MMATETDANNRDGAGAPNAVARLALLRAAMQAQGCAAVILPTGDPHISEYPPAHWCSRAWLSGFSGSAGTLVVTQTEAALWTDGRYYAQAPLELAGSTITLQRQAEPDCPKPEAWLPEHLPAGAQVLCDGWQLASKAATRIEKALAKHSITLRLDLDPVATIWKDRPPLPTAPTFVHDIELCGESVSDKLSRLRAIMAKQSATHYLVSSLDAVAWLLNIRGGDVPYTPVVLAHLLVTPAGVDCFMAAAACTPAVREHLQSVGVTLHPYDAVLPAVQAFDADAALLLDADRICATLQQAVPTACRQIKATDPLQALKAVKHATEIGHLRESTVRDGAFVAELLCWTERELAAGRPVTERGAASHLAALRTTAPRYLGPSFEMIAAYGEHAAMMHYAATPATDATLAPHGFFLMDTGAQYLDGTTDMTRTMACGPLSEQQCRDYTLVLKGHIALCRAVFMHGTTGSQLDILARGPLARVGLDYRCGTGHGVGFCLGVHEGPQFISNRPGKTKLEPGMVLTNEPGVYREGEYGIRIENTLLVREHAVTECGQFLAFEMLSYCPIDTRPIVPELLSEEEIAWLDDYHAEVLRRLSPRVDPPTRDWLAQSATRPLRSRPQSPLQQTTSNE